VRRRPRRPTTADDDALARLKAELTAKLDEAEAWFQEYLDFVREVQEWAPDRDPWRVFPRLMRLQAAKDERARRRKEAMEEHLSALEALKRRAELEAAARQPVANGTKARQRPPGEFPKSVIPLLEALLAQRERTGAPTQDEIAEAVEHVAKETVAGIRFDRNRARQAEGLRKLGWPLVRSHPDFSPTDGFVCWPTVKKAREILAFEQAA
jgi:hypothetical protein